MSNATRSTSLLFLDIDGVLNAHEQHENKFCGIGDRQARLFNGLLKKLPDLQIVLSSAWRYMILGGGMTLDGFSYLLSTHGVCSHKRLHGHTDADETASPKVCLSEGGRAELILRYVDKHKPRQWCAIDDMILPLPDTRFVRTQPDYGLTILDIDKIVDVLEAQKVKEPTDA